MPGPVKSMPAPKPASPWLRVSLLIWTAKICLREHVDGRITGTLNEVPRCAPLDLALVVVRISRGIGERFALLQELGNRLFGLVGQMAFRDASNQARAFVSPRWTDGDRNSFRGA